MTPTEQTQLMQLAGLSARLLGVHLDAADPRTSRAVADAIDRVVDALLGWHDALAVDDAGHPAGRSAAATSPDDAALTLEPDRTPGFAELVTSGGLDRIAASAQAGAIELSRVARAIARVRVQVNDRQAQRGAEIADAAELLAGALAELGARAAQNRSLFSGSEPDQAMVERAAHQLRRAEQAVRSASAATLPA